MSIFSVFNKAVLGSSKLLFWILHHRQSLALPVMFIGAFVLFSVGTQNFMSVDNLTNVARQSVYLLIVSLGQFIVIVNGGMDLSVGSVVSLTSVLGATVMAAIYAAFPAWPAMALLAGLGVALLVGITVGVMNGLGVSPLRIPPFMMTLGIADNLGAKRVQPDAGRGVLPEYGHRRDPDLRHGHRPSCVTGGRARCPVPAVRSFGDQTCRAEPGHLSEQEGIGRETNARLAPPRIRRLR